MRQTRVLAACALLAALAAAAFITIRHRHHPMLHTGDRLVAFSVSSPNGGSHTIRPEGRPQLINVFATWCPPCREETPLLAAAAHGLERRGVAVVAIDQQEPASRVEQFARDFSLPYPVYIDDSGITHQLLGARIIPMTIYVDPSGRIVWEHAGPLSPSELHNIASLAEANAP